MYPSEYAYHKDSVERIERDSANCRNYQSGLETFRRSEDYIHCNGTQLRLTDSDFGLDKNTFSDYYLWPAGSRSSQLLFIFPTRVNLTTITLHYYSTRGRSLPRLRFWSVPDEFDVWDAPTSIYSREDVAAVPPGEEPAGYRNISNSFNTHISTTKILLVKFSSSYPFQLSEVEFVRSFCSLNQQVSTSILTDPTKSSVYSITIHAKSTFKTELEKGKTSEFYVQNFHDKTIVAP